MNEKCLISLYIKSDIILIILNGTQILLNFCLLFIVSRLASVFTFSLIFLNICQSNKIILESVLTTTRCSLLPQYKQLTCN